MFFIKMFKVILISLLAFFLLLSCSKDEKIVYEPTQEDIASSTYKEAVEALEKGDAFFAAKKFKPAIIGQ